MLDHLPASNAIEVVKAGGRVIEQPLIHDEHGAAFAENFVDLLYLVDEAGLGERALFRLKTGFVVFSITVVLVELISIVGRPISVAAYDNHLKIFCGQGFVGVGLVEVSDLGRTVDLSATAAIGLSAFRLEVVPVLHNLTLLEPENVEADSWTGHVEFRLSNDVVAVGKDSDCVHSDVGRQASGPSPESLDAVLDLGIMLNKVLGIDDPGWFRISGFETL
ncbi:MAG TPA: hypothetical protein VK617_05120 [Gemmatimonadaceae bacterium]|nr:hypothetical protein [Gemmatimonadaceae bacterium]